MNVHHFAGESIYHLFIENGQEPGIHNQIRLLRQQQVPHSSRVSMYIRVRLALQDLTGNTVSRSSLQRVHAGLGSNHTGDLPIGDLSPVLGVQQSLQIGAPTGN